MSGKRKASALDAALAKFQKVQASAAQIQIDVAKTRDKPSTAAKADRLKAMAEAEAAERRVRLPFVFALNPPTENRVSPSVPDARNPGTMRLPKSDLSPADATPHTYRSESARRRRTPRANPPATSRTTSS